MPKAILPFCILLISFSTPDHLGGSGSARQLPGIAPCNDMSQMEMNQCFDEEFRKADARLNEVYGKLLSSMQKKLVDARRKNGVPEDVLHGQQQIGKLKAAESAWLSYRDLHCAAARHQTEPGTISPMVWSICMTTVTNHRIEEIHDAYELQGSE